MISALLEAGSAGVAHIFLGADRVFILMALGALQRRLPESLTSSCCWSLGHLFAFLVSASHLLPVWRHLVEWNMYISGLLLISFGFHINWWLHLYADADCSRHNEAEWSKMELGGRLSKHTSSSLEDDSIAYCGPCQQPLLSVAGIVPYLAGNCSKASVVAAIVLGFFQGLISPDFAFAAGSAWAGQAFMSANLPYLAFSFAIAFCACLVASSAWMMTSSEPRSSRSQRFARRSVGVGLCCVGFLWLLLVVQLDLQITAAGQQASATGSAIPSLRKPNGTRTSGGLQCPLPVSVGGVNFGSAPTWNMVAKLDPWWTHELVELHRRPPFRFTIDTSRIGGCGVFADEDLPVGARIGLAGILSGPWDYSAALVHVTPWLGIAINHCGHGTAELRREGALLMLETRQAVKKGQEITFDYDRASETIPIERAQPEWTC